MTLPQQCELVVKTLVACDDVVGVVLGGSYARGDALAASDLDLFVYVRPDVTDRIESVEERLRSVVPLLQLPPRYVAHFGWSLTCVFADGAIVQVNVNDHQTVPMNPMRQRGRIVHDPIGICRRLQDQARQIATDLHVVEHAAGTRLLVRLIFCVRALRKGELLRAHALLSESAELLAVLYRIEQRAYDAATHWSHPLKRIERDLPAVAQDLLEIVNRCDSVSAALISAERVRERAVRSGRARGWLDQHVDRMVADEFDQYSLSRSSPAS